MQKNSTIMILDDHHIVQHGLSIMIRDIPGLSIIGRYTRSRDLLDALKELTPDVLLLDFELHPNDVDGYTLTKVLKRHYPNLRILTLTSHAKPSIMELALNAGSDGFCSKGSEVGEIAIAIHRLLTGRQYVPEHLAQPHNYDISETAKRVNSDRPTAEIPTLSRITHRERQVIELFLMGLSITEISKKLARDRKTISGHKQSAYRKLGISSDAELFNIKHLLK